MSIIYNDTQEKSELQKRITAELRENQNRTASAEGDPYQHKDTYTPGSEYQKDLKPTTTIAWAWILIVIATVGLIIYTATL